MVVFLSSRGQLVIPKAIREALGLAPGSRFHIQLWEGKIILEPVAGSLVDALHGRYAGTSLVGDLEAEHRQEIEHEAPVRP